MKLAISAQLNIWTKTLIRINLYHSYYLYLDSARPVSLPSPTFVFNLIWIQCSLATIP